MNPRNLARTAGVLYVLEGATSVAGALLIPGSLIVAGNAAATAANILGNESLYLLGTTASMISVALHAALVVFLYELFRCVGGLAARVFMGLGLMAVVLQAVSASVQLPALILLNGSPVLGAEQAQTLALLSLEYRAELFNVYLGFFGFRCAALGYLVLRASFMPRVIGALLLVTGAGYLTLLWPPLAAAVAPFNLIIAAPGELSLVIWLLLVGVDRDAWTQQAGSEPARPAQR